MSLGLFEDLGNCMRKHVDEPIVLVHAMDALQALMLKEPPAKVQKLARDIIPAVVYGVKAVSEKLLGAVHVLTKDNADMTAFALRVGCRLEWLAESSSVRIDENGKPIVDSPPSSRKK